MTKRAVIVGVDDYSTQFPGGKSNLHGCLADAQSMRDLLIDVFGFDASQSSTYLDGNASRTIIPCGICLSPEATGMDGNVSQVTGQGNGVMCSVDDNKSLVQLSKSTVIAACRYDEVDLETGGHGALTQGFLDIVNASDFRIS